MAVSPDLQVNPLGSVADEARDLGVADDIESIGS
jgi:hypothetical protein